MNSWNTLPNKETVEKTAAALRANGFEVAIAENAAAAKTKALEWIPAKAEVFTMTSATQGRAMRKLGAGPDVSVGSVHALTEDGKFLVASLTGSQLPAYAYGAGTAIFIVSTKKIVKNLDEAWNRFLVASRSYS